MQLHKMIYGKFLFVLFLCALSRVGESLDGRTKQLVDRAVRETMRCGSISSLSISMLEMEADPSAYTKSYGQADLSSQRPADRKTQYCIGGATQTFTAVLLAKLLDEAENRTITWTTPIEQILGHRIALRDLYRSHNIDLMDIFGQRSGLKNMAMPLLVKPYTAQDLVNKLRYLPEVAGFREKYVPNKVLFALVAEVIEHLGQDSWQNLMTQHILEPLGIEEDVSFLASPDIRSKSLASPTIKHQGKHYPLSLEALKGQELIEAFSGLCISGDAMSKWLSFIIREGYGSRNNIIVPKKILHETFTSIQSRGHGSPYVQGYRQPDLARAYVRNSNTLGWIEGTYGDYRFYSQDGYIPGYQTLMTVIPDRKVGVFVSFSGPIGPKSFATKVVLNIMALDYLMQGQPWIQKKDICGTIDKLVTAFYDPADTYNSPKRVAKNEENEDLEEYAGKFKNYAFGDVEVKFNESERNPEKLELSYGLATFRLEPTDETNVFMMFAESPLDYITEQDRIPRADVLATFDFYEFDNNKRVKSVAISGIEETTAPVFSRAPRVPYIERVSAHEPCGTTKTSFSVFSVVALMVLCFLR